MAWNFAASSYCRMTGANFLNDIDKFSISAWVNLDTIDSTKKQYLWSHRGVTNQISVRKLEGASPIFRFSVTDSVNKTCDSTTVAAAGTPYHVLCTWEKNVEMKIYVNGVLEGTTPVATFHTVNYNSGDSNTPLHMGGKSDNSDLVLGSLEGIVVYVGQILTANQAKVVYEAGWPGLAALQPDFFALLDGSLLGQIPDLSGKQRHVTASTEFVGTITNAGWIGRWDAEDDTPDLGRKIAATTGAPQPGPWIDFPTQVPHPGMLLVVTGLPPNTLFEFVVNAYGADGQVSPDQSVPLTSYANGAIIRHTPKKLFIG